MDNYKTSRTIALLIMSLLLNACTSAGLFVINSAARLDAQHEKSRDISYGPADWQALDVYRPQSESDDLPVILFFYGGGWDSGAKESYLFVAQAFTELGYVVVVPDYVKYPTGKFPQFMEDGARAFAWTRENVEQYGGDPQRIFMAGHSAGAHLGALLLTDDRYLEAQGYSPTDIRAFAGLAGPYNFTPEEPQYQRIFAPPENYPLIRASRFVSGDEPPMFLARGGDDGTVGPQNQARLAESLQGAGIEHQTHTYPGVSHVGILLGMAPLLRRNSTVTEDIHSFFSRYH